MKETDKVGITFVNTVINRGIYCGVANITLGAFNFTPNENNEVEVDHVIATRLRLDLECLKQLRDATIHLCDLIEKPQQPVTETPIEHSESVPNTRPISKKGGEKTH